MLYIYTDSCDLLRVGYNFTFSDSALISHAPANLDKNKKKKGKETSTEKEDASGGMPAKRNPIKLLQELAKRYGVKNLLKR